MASLPRHIILSRKGFDAGTGCVPSPIFADGAMLSLPIPDEAGTVRYGDLSFRGHDYGKLISDCGAKRRASGKRRNHLRANDRAHLDPDLVPELRRRRDGWRPAFGQCGKDATILWQHGVGEGDLFIFFGWFRRCELVGSRYRFVKGAPDLHVIFGYLRIGQVIHLASDRAPRWALEHPHLHGTARKSDRRNTLYVTAEHLGMPGCQLPGAAAFTHFDAKLQLTAPGMTRSWWQLPTWFYPAGTMPALSSHENNQRWKLDPGRCLLQSVARGQEFVLDVTHYPLAVQWAADIIRGRLQVGG